MKKYASESDRVVEKPTEQIVYTGHDSRQVANWLNGGHGFNGFTPPFFLNRFCVA